MQVAAETEGAQRRSARASGGLRLRRGRTRILAGGDLAALTLAYAVTYAASEHIGSLPPVAAPAWLLALLGVVSVPAWLALFTAHGLYEHDAARISVASFDEVGDVLHALLAGSLAFLVLDQGLRRLTGWWVYSALEATLFLVAAVVLVPLVRGSIRSWLLPRVMRRRRALVVGTGLEAADIERKLRAHPEYGLEGLGRL